MILRKVTAPNMTDALAKVEREVGADALIVDTSTDGGVATVIARRPEPQRAAPGPSEARVARTGFAAAGEPMRRFGLSARLVGVVERAATGLDPHLLAKGSPALAPVVRRVLGGLIRCRGIDSRGVALVGPTGVGKTTTLAKLAARDATHEDLRVGIVTTDTYRIAAVEQLRAFADMMGVPFRVAFTPSSLRDVFEEWRDRDRIYVDTSGRSPADAASLRAMHGLFRHVDAGVHLCLPAASRYDDAAVAMRAFGAFAPRALVVTKWDETSKPGEVVSLAIERDMAISFITDGQRVPEDIRPATGSWLAARMLEDV